MLCSSALVLLALSGCARGCTSSRPPIHLNPNMDVQPRYEPQAASAFFYDGAEMRPPVAGTVARGELRDQRAVLDGQGRAAAPSSPRFADARSTMPCCARGQQRFDIYCARLPRQGRRRQGHPLRARQGADGVLPRPTACAQMPDGQIFDTITNGFGLMPSYRYPIPVRDRWAIIVHLRELQAHRLERTGGTCRPSRRLPRRPPRRRRRAAATPARQPSRRPPAGAAPAGDAMMKKGTRRRRRRAARSGGDRRHLDLPDAARVPRAVPRRRPAGRARDAARAGDRRPAQAAQEKRDKAKPLPGGRVPPLPRRSAAASPSGWRRSSTCSSPPSCWRCRSSP